MDPPGLADVDHLRRVLLEVGAVDADVAEATAALVRAVSSDAGRLPVVLTGGCFQNALLAERVVSEVEQADGLRVFLHRRVPPGDGGLALGQAVVAGALARAHGAGGL